MTTIEDKIKLFSSIILENVEKQSQQKLDEAVRRLEERYAAEKAKIENMARQIEADKVKKAEVSSIQIISGARLEARLKLSGKKEELVSNTVSELRSMAGHYTGTPEYEDYLRDSIKQVLSVMKDEKQLLFYFTKNDLTKYETMIRNTIAGLVQKNTVYMLMEADSGIIGGCLCLNEQNTRRADHTMASVLSDSIDLIGQTVTDNLTDLGGVIND